MEIFLRGPEKRVALPPLSPTFAYADDAARYAHTLINEKRDREYGGVILRRPDGCFVATLPVKGANESFNIGLVLSTDSNNQLLHPDGYTCVAFYHSHPSSLDELRGWLTTWSTEELRTLNNFFSQGDVIVVAKTRLIAQAHYLSGPSGSLIKYVSTGSSDEHALVSSALAGVSDSDYRSKTMLDFVLPLAKAGELSVIESSEIWGGKVGRIGADFKVYSAAHAHGQIIQPLLSPSFITAQDAARCVSQLMGERKHRQFGVILKSTYNEEYVATLPLAGGAFDLDRIFPRPSLTQSYSLPFGFDFHAIYIGTPKTPQPSTDLPFFSVYKAFVSPMDVQDALLLTVLGRGQLGMAFSSKVELFISTNDGAVLSYVPADLSNEFSQNAGQAMLNKLESGALTLVEYVHQMASRGDLTVHVPSPLWGSVGPVDSRWRPYATPTNDSRSPYMKRWLTPARRSCASTHL